MKSGLFHRSIRWLALAAALAQPSSGSSALAQGTVNFNNLVPGVVDAPVIFCPGVGPSSFFRTTLWIYRGGFELTQLFPSTTFAVGGDSSVGYVVPVTVDVPGVLPGGQVTLIMGVSGIFGPAEAGGQSAPFTVTVGGAGLPPGNLVGLQSFAVGTCVPEPKTIIIAVAALVAVIVSRVFCQHSQDRTNRPPAS